MSKARSKTPSVPYLRDGFPSLRAQEAYDLGLKVAAAEANFARLRDLLNGTWEETSDRCVPGLSEQKQALARNLKDAELRVVEAQALVGRARKALEDKESEILSVQREWDKAKFDLDVVKRELFALVDPDVPS